MFVSKPSVENVRSLLTSFSVVQCIQKSEQKKKEKKENEKGRIGVCCISDSEVARTRRTHIPSPESATARRSNALADSGSNETARFASASAFSNWRKQGGRFVVCVCVCGAYVVGGVCVCMCV